MPANTLSITDNRTGKTYEVPIEYDTIKAGDLRQIKVNAADFGMMTYDPAFMNTASCKSSITYIDGEQGILRYRGYPIEDLAAKSTFLEVAWLLIHGELPTKAEIEALGVPEPMTREEARSESVRNVDHNATPEASATQAAADAAAEERESPAEQGGQG